MASCGTSNKENHLPNIVYILADDLGYGDLSCYGQKKFSTPNIDRLAVEGMLFTQHYTGCTVSAPSRSSLMTGLHTGHTPIRGNKEWEPEGNWPLPAESFTVAELLKSKGYATGLLGNGDWAILILKEIQILRDSMNFSDITVRALHIITIPIISGIITKKYFFLKMTAVKQAYSPDLIHKAALDFH